MRKAPLKVLAVVGSLNEKSVTRVVINHAAKALSGRGCQVDVLVFYLEPLALFNPEATYAAEHYKPLQKRAEAADVYLLGTPDYHGSISGVMKNFLDHFWHEFAGKLFATVVGSYEKGLTVTDQLRTVARQCYAWSLPYGVSFVDKEDVKDGQVASEALLKRLDMMARDICVYGDVIARQRATDLEGAEPGFMARWRK